MIDDMPMEASKSPSSGAGTVGYPDGPANLAQVHDLFKGALAGEPRLKMLRGFKLDFSGNSDFHKVYFSARCDCGTAALLSVEVDRAKSLLQVEEALPELTDHLKGKVGQFQAMSCEMHSMMRTGNREAKPGMGAGG
ncbi:MAG: hypothetical protein J4F43_00760 [Dehalococcoidia bacterium]|nr:hypothetical protein [Dehalococcoidia bacterium]